MASTEQVQADPHGPSADPDVPAGKKRFIPLGECGAISQ